MSKNKASKDITKLIMSLNKATKDITKLIISKKVIYLCFLEWARKLSPFQEVKLHLVHGPYLIFVCSLQMWASAVPWFLNVLSQTGHLKILMPKVFMWEDGYNFGAPISETVGNFMGAGGCDSLAGTGVSSSTFFAGFTISAKLAKSEYFPRISSKTAIPIACISSAFLIVCNAPSNFATSLLYLALGQSWPSS